jgi:transcription initiation factor TFIID subunit 8
VECDLLSSFKDAKEEPPAHIPAFLPALPDQHTYKETPVYEGRQIEAGQAKLEMHQSFRKAEKALISLQVGLCVILPIES